MDGDGGAMHPVREARRSLHCRTCGAGNPLTQEAREHGWYRCAYCESPEPVRGAGDFAIQGPSGRATRIVRPGSSEIETADDQVLPLRRALFRVALVDLGIGIALHVTSRTDPVLAAALGPALVGLLAVLALGLLALTLTRQRLAVARDGLDLWWVTFGLVWRHRHVEIRRVRTTAHLTGRTGVEVHAADGQLRVHVTGEASVRWLERQIVAAVEDAQRSGTGDRVPCPGCGGPVAEERALRDAGAVECPHCGTGLVQTGGGIAMPDARLWIEGGLCGDDELPRPVRSGDTETWTAVPWWRTHPFAAPVNVVLVLALDAAVIGGAWWGVLVVPAFEVVAGGAALAVTLASLYSTRAFFHHVFARHTFRLGSRVLEHERRIGPFAHRRRIPLARLVCLDVRRRTRAIDGEDVPVPHPLLDVVLAARSLRIEPYGRHLLPVARAVAEAVPARLEAMGRTCTLTRPGRASGPRR